MLQEVSDKHEHSEKREVVGQLGERMQRARACVLAEYKGLTVADLTALRRRLDAHAAEFKIAKKPPNEDCHQGQC